MSELLAGTTHPVLGLIDHGITLTPLDTKASIVILRALLDTIGHSASRGRSVPNNEASFTRRLFSFTLVLLGIQHQTTDLHTPWMNGRIERYSGTLKEKLDWLHSVQERPEATARSVLRSYGPTSAGQH